MRILNPETRCDNQNIVLRQKIVFVICLCLTLLLVAFFFNRKYEVVAIHPLRSDGLYELKVMTWNIHCSKGADSVRQRLIAERVLEEDADFVLLNEFNQDSCVVMDSLLRTRYPYTEESLSHQKNGDIFYSKKMMFHSGRVKTPKKVKRIKTIKATISVGDDSIQIFGVHMASNHYNGTTLEKEFESDTTSYNRYKDAQEKRCIQAYWVKNAVIESKHPVIVMGDMNDFNCSAPLDTFSTCGLRDCWWEGGEWIWMHFS